MERSLLVQKKEVVDILLKQNVIVSKKILEQLDDEKVLQDWHTCLKKGVKFEEINSVLQSKNCNVLSSDSGNFVVGVFSEKSSDCIEDLKSQSLQNTSSSCFGKDECSGIFFEVLFDYDKHNNKKSIQDFIDYFNKRYKQLSKFLQTRTELQNLTSIARIQGKQDRETISVIAYVVDKQVTKNDNIILTIEDDTGQTKAIVGKAKEDCYNQAKDLVFDEVIGISGVAGDNVIFINNIVLPDIPIQTELKKADEAVNVAIISDIHYGSNLFLEKEFRRFLNWTRGEQGSDEQKQLAKNTKFIIIAGDLVDGVGVYPNQDEELKVKDIKVQYKELAEYLSLIPEDKKIIIIPGNHDAARLSEPQPKIKEFYAKPLYELKNVVLLSNPARIKISTKTTGFEFLIYHGYSYTFYGNYVESIRATGKDLSDKTDLIMQFLLKRRHLAPTHTSSLYVPDKEEDCLVIEKEPDFFISGHMHKSLIGNYRGVTTITGSCWQATTSFMEKVGVQADPAKVPVINLQTRNIKIIDFNQNE